MWYLVEYNPGIDYLRFAQFLHAFVSNLCPKSQPAMDKRQVKSLLQLAQSSRERELIRYTVYKSSGVTQSTGRYTVLRICFKERRELKSV